MAFDAETIVPRMWCILAVLARAGGFAALAPTFGSCDGAIKIRVVLAVLLALILVPFTPAPVAGNGGLQSIDVVFAQLAWGLLLGFALRVLFTGITMAVQLVEQQLGFPGAGEWEEDDTSTALGRMYRLTALAVFFCLGGHRLVVAGLLDSSVTVAPVVGDCIELMRMGAEMLSTACWLAVRVAAPVVIALVTANFAVGMISRVLPQFSGASMAVPVQITFGLVLVLLSLAAVGTVFRDGLGSLLSVLHLEP